MDPYKVDVTEIIHDLGMSIPIDDEIDLGVLEYAGETYTPARPARIDVSVTNTGAGVVAYGSVDAAFRAECSRCLAPFTLEVSGEVEGFYTTPEKAEELSEDQEWEPLGDGIIDLSHAIESAVRIELPFAPLHAEDCAGICPLCGCDLNEGTCTCDTEVRKPTPFDALEGMFSGEDAPEE